MMKVVRLALLFVFLATSGIVHAEEGKATKKNPEGTRESLLKKGIMKHEVGSFEANLHMRVQAWGGWVGEEGELTNGDRMQETGLMLRRARLGIDGQFLKGVNYKLEMDLYDQERTAGPLYEAWIQFRPTHFAEVTVGVQSFIFLKEEMMSSGFLPHLDRSIGSNAMSPENTMGLVFRSEPWKKHLSVSLGVFNGLRRAPTFFGGYEGVGNSLGNRYEELAYAARIDFMPLATMTKGMADPKQSKKIRLALGGAGFYNDGSTITTMGYSGYLHAKMMGIHLFAEFSQDEAEPTDSPTTTATMTSALERRVINASLGYVFLKNTLGLAVRYTMLDDNLDKETQGDEWQLGATLTWYMVGDYLKAQLEYTHREELHGLSLDNDSVLGGVQLLF